jgi:hypothetical protein
MVFGKSLTNTREAATVCDSRISRRNRLNGQLVSLNTRVLAALSMAGMRPTNVLMARLAATLVEVRRIG